MLGYYCVSPDAPKEDPSGQYPRECDFSCTPDCKGKECGDDGCGGSCGECGPDSTCLGGICCKRGCEGKECGPDNCGGVCGYCRHPLEDCIDGKCVYHYGCKATDTARCPDCACEKCVCEKRPSCCYDKWDAECVRLCQEECGGCKPCVPNCEGKECGDDGCHGVCGYCRNGTTCRDGKCVPCSCEGKECGDDGCGHSCGECKEGEVCDNGHCRPCKHECDPDAECGYSECGDEICGLDLNSMAPDCPFDSKCIDHKCVYCTGWCKGGWECGDDGCGGSCGECGPCEECISHHCRKIPDCVPDQAEVAEEGPPEQGPEVAERPDVAESVDRAEEAGKDVAELHDIKADSVEPSEETSNPTPKDSSEQQDAPPPNDSSQDTHHTNPLPAKKSSGGCSPGIPVPPLPLGLVLGMLLWRRRR